ncbi:MAG: hypothetical protein JRJ00_12810, partial [Deltaproteobacteria bacterium]|nr:hypothetical protein [Deltaproteobacteria bacterium]
LSMKRGPFDFVVPADARHPNKEVGDFDQLEATELYCPECGRAVPVNKSLLLVLPAGDKYEYNCQYCGEKVGNKMDNSGQSHKILEP